MKRAHAPSDSDSGDDFGPKKPSLVTESTDTISAHHDKKRKIVKKTKHAQEYPLDLERLPNAKLYERSYMHRGTVTHLVYSTHTDFLITGSQDGVLKFWKKTFEGIEFVKQYRASLGPFNSMCISSDGALLCTTAMDKVVKIFDIVNFDQIHMFVVDYIPTACAWVHQKKARSRIAIASMDTSTINVYHGTGRSEPVHSITCHVAEVTNIVYNETLDLVISTDKKGVIEYWTGTDYSFPDNLVNFKYKMDTDLFLFCKKKINPLSVEFNQTGEKFVTMGSDRMVRVFQMRTGKIIHTYNESIDVYLQQKDAKDYVSDTNTNEEKSDPIDFGLRISVEKQLVTAPSSIFGESWGKIQSTAYQQPSNVIFDESGHFILFATIYGIKIINLSTNQVSLSLGRSENTVRFLKIALFQGRPSTIGVSASASLGSGMLMASDTALERKPEDPTIFCTGFNKNRFYWFSKREPDIANINRDILNERVAKDLSKLLAAQKPVLATAAVIHTTMGDIKVKLYPTHCPKTVENFITHAKNGYYNNVIFHRVIKNFMIQTGDPQGDGTGGQSIWGKAFEDEFHPTLRHNRPGTLSMANSGPNTNGSQFFITTAATGWLDNKHTVFGHVVEGMDVTLSIENCKTGAHDRPFDDINIVNIDIIFTN